VILFKFFSGEAKVLEVFMVNERKGKWPVAGTEVMEGVVQKAKSIRIKRGDDILYDGKIYCISW